MSPETTFLRFPGSFMLKTTIGTLLNELLKKAQSQHKQNTKVTVDKSQQAASKLQAYKQNK